ncbi:GspH/FimT family pseudopilin [Xanthomonas cerealis]|uniref:GspH/FimT family pseudopilin n=1 Tax=Xanthomonas cerealis TaxID=3390025 RepID=UPI00057913EE|nr:Tfp pilus assembly protein FimT/FimU [Xanthomonas translucens]UKE48501.1 Tfp pilus assembly protein FimT/FimU [Xanthomonas translucens pv. cerealis]
MWKSSVRGYTLLQLAIVMAMICVLTAIGIPAFQDLLMRQRLAVTSYRLSSQLALARSSAISYGTPVSVCPSGGDGKCLADNDWSHGWMVYRDLERQAQPTDPSRILGLETAPAAASITVISNSGRQAVRFLPDGRSAGSNLSIRICGKGRLLAEVVVNNAGRTRLARAAASQACQAKN